MRLCRFPTPTPASFAEERRIVSGVAAARWPKLFREWALGKFGPELLVAHFFMTPNGLRLFSPPGALIVRTRPSIINARQRANLLAGHRQRS